MIFSEIGKLYATYVRKHYNDAIVVFDGYNNKNEHNKSELIKFISKFLRDDSQNAINCVGDAYTKIVSTALDYSTVDGRTIVVVADDTDIAVMLLYH